MDLETFFKNIGEEVLPGSFLESLFLKRAEKKKPKNNSSLHKNKRKPVGSDKVKVDYSDNEEARLILETLEKTSSNVFLTGQAGTGKSTLLNHFRSTTKKNLVVLAPTGVAAVNVSGQTVHSFCKFPINVTTSLVKRIDSKSEKAELLRNLDMIVIDEISMVRADLLDCLDKFLKLNGKDEKAPFGGYQMVFIGDLYQLPPVDKDFEMESVLFKKYESPYFFHSHAFLGAKFFYHELTKTYRQKDLNFIKILNAVRNNTATSEHLQALNSRVIDGDFDGNDDSLGIFLTTRNDQANRINNHFLSLLMSKPKTLEGALSGQFRESQTPVEMKLTVKTGAKVMMANNDRNGRWVNGTMGVVTRIIRGSDEEPDSLAVELENGKTEYVMPHTWEMIDQVYDKESDSVQKDILGTFTQYPIRLAWAVTIHKSQGKTFNNLFVDLSQGTFAHGQLYVALSRCRTLEGLHLSEPVRPGHIILDKRVVEFLKGFSK